jgi:hypothetical protein
LSPTFAVPAIRGDDPVSPATKNGMTTVRLEASPLAGLRELDANLRAVLLRNLLEIVAARSARTRQDLATLVD